jgi:uncharacterized protein (DUF885 family)
LHETIPGHHFQIALQTEANLPAFRRATGYAAFGEGWASYAETLGESLGVYSSRHDVLDMLWSDLGKSIRLIVDVGIHVKGWTRKQAIDFLIQNGDDVTAEGAEREVERFMAWPGQALAYKIGQMRFLDLRKRAEDSLGAAFDLRTFHDELLRDGALPFPVLEAKMDEWVARERSKVR